MAFILRLFAFAWLALAWVMFGGFGTLVAGPYDEAFLKVFMGGVIFPIVVLLWAASAFASQRRIAEIELAIRRSKE